jgi:hypothetical protein
MKHSIVALVLSCPFLWSASGKVPPAMIAIDYPEDGSLFPPEITPPTILFRTGGPALSWLVDVSFGDGSPGIHTAIRGSPLRIGPIVSSTNEVPKLTPQQAATRTWKPEGALWTRIKLHSRTAFATVTISGISATGERSRGSVRIRTSEDPVGAEIFFRDVPLMPTHTEKGVIEPLSLAHRALSLTGGKDTAVLETLAAAYAETGRFPDASATARRAPNIALHQKDNALASSIRSDIALYGSGTALRIP